MTTTILHADLQRSRFIQHTLDMLANLVPPLFRGPPPVAIRAANAADKAAREAQEVRELAYSYTNTDPGFAADLYAAAARHEGVRVD